MNPSILTKTLYDICHNNILTDKELGSSDRRVVLPEPYIPYLPDDWKNGVLVLAEAQYLQEKTAAGREFMKKMRDFLDTDGRINRVYKGQVLFENEIYLGIGPWDEGPLKLAVHAALGLKPEECAVSNGILWSQVDSSGSSVNPEWEGPIFKRSIGLWGEMLDVMKPSTIVTAGKKAEWVIDAVYHKNYAGNRPEIYQLTHPSSRNINPLKKPFNVLTDLLPRYPEVQAALKDFPALPQNKMEVAVYFACHAVSKYSSRKKDQNG